MLDAMLDPSLPVREAAQLFFVNMWGRQPANDVALWERYQVRRSGRFYREITFIDLGGALTVRAGDEVKDLLVARVSSNLYSLLGVEPEVGRLVLAPPGWSTGRENGAGL